MELFDKIAPSIKGLQETLAKEVNKLQGQNPNQQPTQNASTDSDWQDNMTDEDIAELEKMGCDVSELKIKQQAKQKTQDVTKEQRQEQIKLNKLHIYQATPRSEHTEFFHNIAGKPPIFGSKDKWLERYQNAELIYAAIVQANSDLWEPGDEEYLTAVIVYTNDKTLRYDMDWLRRIADKINQLQESDDVPADCQDFIETLLDQESQFLYKVGTSVTDGVTVWCETLNIPNQSDLPNGCLPPNKILPLLLHHVSDDELATYFIPAKYYV